MKTAMQQLIDRINDLKISCSDPDANWLADMLIRDISEGSKFDNSFLKMEKEQMCQFTYKCHNHYKVYGDFNIEEYYNETYGGNK
jgi:hypothetical protein